MSSKVGKSGRPKVGCKIVGRPKSEVRGLGVKKESESRERPEDRGLGVKS